MHSHILLQLLFLSPILLITTFCAANQETFVQCMSNIPSSGYIKRFKYVHSPHSQSYFNLLRAAEQNPRWVNSTALEPKLIITPYSVDEIRAAVECSKKHGLQIRVKSGGHDYEGVSYTCRAPFVLVDLINLRSINVDLEDETAWLQSGATIGELYYSIAQKSNVHGFPAGLCPSVGVGGHFSGGGFGTLLRKHGLAADNIIDAYIMNARGYVLDRKSMGEDLFWAIRGGGGGSFGIILSWKIKLVRVPPVVTVFSVDKHMDEEGIKLLEKWQLTANQLPEDLFIRVVLQHIVENSTESQAIFNSLFLGSANELLPLMNTSFPELGLQGKDCMEMSWIESVLYFAGFKADGAKEVLLDRVVEYKSPFKAKSDYVTKPMPESAFVGINERLLQEETAFVIMDPYGGRMEQILGSELPFPHRKGNLFNIQYLVKWSGDDGASRRHVDWIREMYEFMEPYVSSSPRAAYLNYRDLDLGINQAEKSSYSGATSWGTKYFKGNYERLAAVKKVVDPDNFFRHQQSIPPLS